MTKKTPIAKIPAVCMAKPAGRLMQLRYVHRGWKPTIPTRAGHYAATRRPIQLRYFCPIERSELRISTGTFDEVEAERQRADLGYPPRRR